jgi:sugar porter (SP) family MFS transporter
MSKQQVYTTWVALTVALGGFLMGFDASVISGVVGFIKPEFSLTELELGWSVSSLTLSATLAMIASGYLSDKYGRRPVLRMAAILYAISAIASAIAPTFLLLVIARMVGGIGVGISLILAPMYIAEIAPPAMRGRMVSFNQLNIVVGISAAFFTNYLILYYGQTDAAWVKALLIDKYQWRWMLGLETLPALLYFVGLFFVPESPRWQIMKGQDQKALTTLQKVVSIVEANQQILEVRENLEKEKNKTKTPLNELFKPSMKLVLSIGIVVAVLQQITGINSVFFYAPMIFEQSGIGTDASFVQAILVGLTNLVFTIVSMFLIDKLGRKPLLVYGVGGIVVSMFLLAYSFGTATYTLTPDALSGVSSGIDKNMLSPLFGKTYENDMEFKNAIAQALGNSQAPIYESELVKVAIEMNSTLILISILGFVAAFAISIGPVMWVLFSELFPLKVRGLAISFVGFVNSAISFLVQLVFPWELATLGSSITFLIYGVFALAGLAFIVAIVPETKGRTLEELEKILVK